MQNQIENQNAILKDKIMTQFLSHVIFGAGNVFTYGEFEEEFVRYANHYDKMQPSRRSIRRSRDALEFVSNYEVCQFEECCVCYKECFTYAHQCLHTLCIQCYLKLPYKNINENDIDVNNIEYRNEKRQLKFIGIQCPLCRTTLVIK